MLFNRDITLKNIRVFSEREKIRCILSKIMIEKDNVILLNEPTTHLDLEFITSLNNSLISIKGTILLISRDNEFIKTVYNRIIEIGSIGFIEKHII